MNNDKRTQGEIHRDSIICLMDKFLNIIQQQLKQMEDSASSRREYKHAQNYEKIRNLIKDVRKTPFENEDD